MQPILDFQFMVSIIPEIFKVIPVTLNITVVAMFFALIIGTITALVRIYKIPVACQLAALYLSFTRGTPLLVQIYLSYYGIPKFLDYAHSTYGWNIDVNGIQPLFLFTLRFR